MSERIEPNSRVTLQFSLSLPDGTVVDGSEENDALTFRMGDGTLIEGLELALYGLKAGDEQTLAIPPQSGFGFPDPKAITEMPLEAFPSDLQPEVGQIMSFNLPDGNEIPGSILEVRDTVAVVDLNHPLAGQEVIFSVKILTVENQEE